MMTVRVRKVYGKILQMRRIDRNYIPFYEQRLELLDIAQCKIAYIWRMNRIKINLARKKREKEEAARKKAMAGKDKYNRCKSNAHSNFVSYQGNGILGKQGGPPQTIHQDHTTFDNTHDPGAVQYGHEQQGGSSRRSKGGTRQEAVNSNSTAEDEPCSSGLASASHHPEPQTT